MMVFQMTNSKNGADADLLKARAQRMMQTSTNGRGLSAPGGSVHALVDKVGDKFIVFGRECGEVQRLLQHSGVLGVGLPRGREKGG